MPIRVSVIVPTCGRTALLRRCLEALARQDFDKSGYEVLVADDAGSPDTRLLVGGSAWEGMQVRYVPIRGRHGPAAARNAGLRVSRGEIIAFTDDDCIPHPGWLRAGTAAFVDGIAGVSGRIIVPLGERPTDYEANAARLAHSRFVTANCFYRRPALLKAGGFDEDFRIPWREDSDLYFRLVRAGSRLALAPEAVVTHPVRPAPWGVSIGQQRKSMFNALLYKKHPKLCREMLRPVVPWHYYGMVAALILGVVMAFLGMKIVAALSLAAWLGGTAAFCMYRLRHASRAPRHVLEMAVTSLVIPPLCIFWRLVGAVRYRVFFL
jgi:cellulose synthase/poly-beta-1,6-N-acetylglucosamine synthase-like glycosyltransferase